MQIQSRDILLRTYDIKLTLWFNNYTCSCLGGWICEQSGGNDFHHKTYHFVLFFSKISGRVYASCLNMSLDISLFVYICRRIKRIQIMWKMYSSVYTCKRKHRYCAGGFMYESIKRVYLYIYAYIYDLFYAFVYMWDTIIPPQTASAHMLCPTRFYMHVCIYVFFFF